MKIKAVFCLLMAIFPMILYSQELYKAVYNGDIDYIKRYIENLGRYSSDHQEISSNSDLRLLRNTIYAMHGYKFKSKDLQEHFQKFIWYNGTKETVDNELSENEKKLIRIISAMEAVNPPSQKNIVGEWVYPVSGGVDGPVGFVRYFFYTDGRVEGFNNRRGRWYLEGNTFRTVPDSDSSVSYTSPLDWSEVVKYLRIWVVEYDGKLYKACNFFNTYMYEPTIPKNYWE